MIYYSRVFNLEISIVVPIYNEAKVLGSSLKELADFLHVKKWDYEIILVDDGSKDASGELIREFQDSEESVRILTHSRNRGKGAAVKTGILAADKKWVLFTDADFSTPIAELDNFQGLLDKDVVVGSRAVGGGAKNDQPWFRQMGGKLINKIVKLLMFRGIHDTQCGFKLFRTKIAKRLFSKLTTDRFGFDVEVLYLAQKYGYKIREVGVRWTHEQESKVNPVRDGLRVVLDMFRIRMNDLLGRYSEN